MFKVIIKFNFGYFKYYYRNNDLQNHRLDGPSFENTGGDKFWYKNGKDHREDGPADEWGNGDKHYWLNGKEYSEKEYWVIIRFGGFV